MDMEKESEWDKKIEYNSTDMGELGSFIRVEYAKNIIKEAISNREKEIAEEVEKMRKEEKNLPTVETSEDLWDVCENNRNIGGNEVIDKVLSILKH